MFLYANTVKTNIKNLFDIDLIEYFLSDNVKKEIIFYIFNQAKNKKKIQESCENAKMIFTVT